jgi:hypothetical protein
MRFCFAFVASSLNFAMRRPSSAGCGSRSAHEEVVLCVGYRRPLIERHVSLGRKCELRVLCRGGEAR